MKKIFLPLIFLFIVGCTEQKNIVNTIISEDKNILISINYPITDTKIDSDIKKDINRIESDFKNKYSDYNDKSELNIDYSFNKINNYISVILHVYISSPRIDNKINYTMSYLYDANKNKKMELEDIINIDDTNSIIIQKLKNKYKNIDENKINDLLNNMNIGFDYQNINIFINYNNEILEINIPINECNTEVNLNTENINKVFKKIDNKTRIIDPNAKVIALTFDDGPSIYTDKIIEFLHDNNCSATFFVLGNKVELYSDTIKKSINYGNEIGNHSYNHKWLIKLSNEEILNQVNKTQEIMTEKIGYTPTILRPTYGSTNDFIKNNIDLDIILWNVDTMDWKYKSVNKIVSRASKKLKDGNIILMHDIHNRTYEAVKKIVPILKEQGYTCVTISELKEINLIRKIENEK